MAVKLQPAVLSGLLGKSSSIEPEGESSQKRLEPLMTSAGLVTQKKECTVKDSNAVCHFIHFLKKLPVILFDFFLR